MKRQAGNEPSSIVDPYGTPVLIRRWSSERQGQARDDCLHRAYHDDDERDEVDQQNRIARGKEEPVFHRSVPPFLPNDAAEAEMAG